jgi:predicted helicase
LQIAENKRQILYARMPEDWRRGQKYNQLDEWKTAQGLKWKTLKPDGRNTWLTAGQHDDFQVLPALGSKSSKGSDNTEAIFRTFSLGTVSARDSYVFNYSAETIGHSMRKAVEAYAEMLARYKARRNSDTGPASFVDVDDPDIKWSRQTLASLGKLEETHFSKDFVTPSLYRPFTKMAHYFDDFWNEERYRLPNVFPNVGVANKTICINGVGSSKPYHPLATDRVFSFDLLDKTQSFAYFTFDADGTNRRENITDWALSKFRAHYADDKITKWDIFHATYAVLHHPEYRTRYAANLKRELPRIPFPPDFHTFAAAGKRLMELHIDYEKQPEYVLEQIEDPKAEVSFRVDRMKLSKDKSELRYNDFLLLRGIPAAAYDYRLGNRSALEWVIDQYRISTDPRSGIVNDPNRPGDPKYILRLIGQVVTVSLETQRIIEGLPSLKFE